MEDPSSPEAAIAFQKRGIIFQKIKQPKLAIQDLNQSLKMNDYSASNFRPEFLRARAYLYRGMAEGVLGEKREAISDLDRSLAAFHDFAPAYYEKGMIYYSMKQYEEALKNFMEVLRIDPTFDNANSYNMIAGIYTYLNQPMKEIEYTTELINRFPQYANETPYGLRGETYYHMGKYAKAVQDFSKAIEINPRHSGVYLERGNAYFNLKKYANAKDDYLMTLKLDPKGDRGEQALKNLETMATYLRNQAAVYRGRQ